MPKAEGRAEPHCMDICRQTTEDGALVVLRADQHEPALAVAGRWNREALDMVRYNNSWTKRVLCPLCKQGTAA